jgi:hypothetical protein
LVEELVRVDLNIQRIVWWKMLLLMAKLEEQFAESGKLKGLIRENLRSLGYGG